MRAAQPDGFAAPVFVPGQNSNSPSHRGSEEPQTENMDVEKIINSVVARFIGTKHERDVKAIQPLVRAINALEPEMQQALRRGALPRRPPSLKTEVQARSKAWTATIPITSSSCKEALAPALVPAFALVREAGRRKLGMRHFDVQLIGGIVLHEGKIAEMKTGEGKTLVATLPAYLNALAGTRRAHRHRERLPGPPRRGMDGPDLQNAGPHRRRDRSRSRRRAAPRRLRRRHHLRHEQRIRFRLSARQHEVRSGRLRPARPSFRASSTKSTPS